MGSYLKIPPGMFLLGGTTLLSLGGTITLLTGGTIGLIPPGGPLVFGRLAAVVAGVIAGGVTAGGVTAGGVTAGCVTVGGTVTVFKIVNMACGPGKLTEIGMVAAVGFRAALRAVSWEVLLT